MSDTAIKMIRAQDKKFTWLLVILILILVCGSVLVLLPIFSNKTMPKGIDNPTINVVITALCAIGYLVVDYLAMVKVGFKLSENQGEILLEYPHKKIVLEGPFEIKVWNYILDVPASKRKTYKYPKLNLFLKDTNGKTVLLSEEIKKDGYTPEFGKTFNYYYTGKDLTKNRIIARKPFHLENLLKNLKENNLVAKEHDLIQ